jgi:hypothetical protein
MPSSPSKRSAGVRTVAPAFAQFRHMSRDEAVSLTKSPHLQDFRNGHARMLRSTGCKSPRFTPHHTTKNPGPFVRRIFIVLVAGLVGLFSTNMYAQPTKSFDFGTAALAFYTEDSSVTYNVSVAPAGFTYDENGNFSSMFGSVNSGSFALGNTGGYFHPGVPAAIGGDIKVTIGNIGCGRYIFTVSASGLTSATFTADFTDYRWATNVVLVK